MIQLLRVSARPKQRATSGPTERLGRESPLALAVIVVASLVAAWIAATVVFDCDIGWQEYVAKRYLEGARLYVDVARGDLHPPLYTWLVAGCRRLALWFALPPLRTFTIIISILAVGSILASLRLLQSFSGILLAGLVFAGLLAWGFYAPGGEHITILLLLPYFSAGARDDAAERLPIWTRAAIGAAAGVGFAIKPHFGLVWLAVEGALARRRGLRSFVRPESVGALAFGAVYLAAIAALTPSYFAEAWRNAAMYAAVSRAPASSLILSPTATGLGIALAAFFVLRPSGISRRLASLCLVAAVAFFATAVLQLKGWTTHMLPTQALAGLAFAMSLPPRWGRSFAPALALNGLLWMGISEQRMVIWNTYDPSLLPETIAAVRRYAPGGPILIAAYQLSPGFPLVNLTDSEWTLPYGHLWMAEALYPAAWGKHPTPPTRYRGPNEWSATERQVFDVIWQGITERPPRIVFLSRPVVAEPFDYRAFLEADPRIRAFLVGYQRAERVGRYDVLVPIHQ